MTKALERGLQLLQILVDQPHGCRFGELATQLQVTRTALMRLLDDLAASGHVQRGGDGEWLGGPALARLQGHASGAPDAATLARLAAPLLDRLMQGCGQTALLMANDDTQMRCLARAEHPDGMALQPVGMVNDNHRYTPWGWFFKPASYWRGDVGRRPGRQPPTLRQIQAELRRLSREGFTELAAVGRRRIAAPVYDGNGMVIAALAVGGHADEFHASAASQSAVALVAEASVLSGLCGWRGAGLESPPGSAKPQR